MQLDMIGISPVSDTTCCSEGHCSLAAQEGNDMKAEVGAAATKLQQEGISFLLPVKSAKK